MITEVLFNKLSQMKTGVDKLSNAVKSTLGPGGQGVIIKRKHATPFITKDGVTVAQSIHLEDPVEDVGAQLIKEVANKTVEGAGDGTTTATVLAQAIFNQGLMAISSGADPVEMKKGMDIAVKYVVERIKAMSSSVKDTGKIKEVATISANYDEKIGGMIADAINEIGENGFIAAEESNGTDTFVKLTKGMQLERGFLSPHFVTSPEKLMVEFDNPFILLVDKRISTVTEMLNILQETAKAGRPLLIIADDIDGEALATLVINKNRGAISVCAIRCPFMAGQKRILLEDIAILTGGKVISEEAGFNLVNAKLEDLGTCERVTVSKDTTVIVKGGGSKEAVDNRIAMIKNEIETTMDENEKYRLKARLAKIDGGIAMIYVGGFTEVEMKERKFRVDDAIFATIAAIEEGIVPGGGIALMNAGSHVNILKVDNDDQKIGVNIIAEAIKAPLKTIIANRGGHYETVIKKIQSFEMNVEAGLDNVGWDARTGEFGDMIEMGIVDPAKVVRLALENAASIVGLTLSTQALIYEKHGEQRVVTQSME